MRVILLFGRGRGSGSGSVSFILHFFSLIVGRLNRRGRERTEFLAAVGFVMKDNVVTTLPEMCAQRG